MGRPRTFDEARALRAALEAFWRNGYAATSLDDLTAAMGLSRSSFYGAFGSKHDVLLAAVRQYVDGVFASVQAIVRAEPDPEAAVRAVVAALTMPEAGGKGCLLVNAIAELAPDDREVCDIARAHAARVLDLVAALLLRVGHGPDAAPRIAGALLAYAFGAATLRKAGQPADDLAGFTAQVVRLAARPS